MRIAGTQYSRAWIGIVAIACTLPGCGEQAVDAPGESAAEQTDSPDAMAQQMIADKEVAEARAWLANEKQHMLWKGDRGEIKKLVEQLYAAGAPQVYAAGISKEGEIEIVAMFMAELPADAATRAKIFAAQSAFWKSYLDEPTAEDLEEIIEKDNGQKYLLFNFDL